MKPRFTSIFHPVAIDAGLGRLAEEPDYARHVEQLIRQVLLTNPGERINRPDFGCGVRRMVFAPADPVAASLAQVTVREALDKWLSTAIEVQEVVVEAVDEKILIRIAYLLRVRRERRYLDVEVP